MKGKILVVALVGALMAISGSGMTLSYFTASDESISNFTVGKVSIKTTKTETDCTDMKYGDTCTQSIEVANTGTTGAYVRVRVLVPIDLEMQKDIVRNFDYDANSYIVGNQDHAVIDGKYYAVYTYVYSNELSAGGATKDLVMSIKNNQKQSTELDSSATCTPKESEESCETETESKTVNMSDFGIKIYTQAIQSSGFSSATEAFNNY